MSNPDTLPRDQQSTFGQWFGRLSLCKQHGKEKKRIPNILGPLYLVGYKI